MADNEEAMKVDERLARLELTVAKEFHHVGTRFDKVDTQLGRLEETVAKEFHQIGRRFDGIDQRFDGIDQRFDGIDQRLDRIETAFKVHDDKLTAGFRDIAERIDRLGSRRSRPRKRT